MSVVFSVEDFGQSPLSGTANEPAALRAGLVAFGEQLRQAGEGQPVSAVENVQPYLASLDKNASDAAQMLAEFIDSLPQCQKPDYHNVAHYLEVAVAGLALGMVELRTPSQLGAHKIALTHADVSDLFIAGLIHDLGHPGGNNGGKPFKIETDSWDLAKTKLVAAGYNPARLKRMHALVMATDPAFGVSVVQKIIQHHATNSNVPAALQSSDAAQGILARELIVDPSLTAMAYTHIKADIFMSLMPETYLSQTQRLHNEYESLNIPIKLLDADGQPIKGAATYFFDNIAFVHDTGFMLASIERLIGLPARATKAAAMEGKIPESSAAKEPIRPTVKVTPPTLQS